MEHFWRGEKDETIDTEKSSPICKNVCLEIVLKNRRQPRPINLLEVQKRSEIVTLSNLGHSLAKCLGLGSHQSLLGQHILDIGVTPTE